MNSSPLKIAVLGAGAWGTALAISFARRHPVRLWARDAAQVAQMAEQRVNARYLPDCPFPAGLELSADLVQTVRQAELLIVATPLSGLRATFAAIRDCHPTPPPILWVSKGFEAGTGLLPHQIASEELPEATRLGVLSGPSFAREVAQDLPAAITLAAQDNDFAVATAACLHSPRLRIYANDDLAGVEVGGAVKNVMAIAAGVADGLAFGHNARAALITRGLAEMSRLAAALGGRPSTMMGLAGLGDLVLTCTGDLSRNRKVGLLLAQNKPLNVILAELGHVAEGVPAAREVLQLAERLGVDMPISAAVCNMLFHHQSPLDAVEGLLGRSPKSEVPVLLEGITDPF